MDQQRVLTLVDRCRETRLQGRMSAFRELNRLRRRSLRKDKTAWLHRIADSAELGFRTGNSRSAYQSITELCQSGKHRHSSPLLTSVLSSQKPPLSFLAGKSTTPALSASPHLHPARDSYSSPTRAYRTPASTLTHPPLLRSNSPLRNCHLAELLERTVPPVN